jgi:hypothetical protein
VTVGEASSARLGPLQPPTPLEVRSLDQAASEAATPEASTEALRAEQALARLQPSCRCGGSCQQRRAPMGSWMDSPILPDRPDDEQRGDERVQARHLPPPYALRVVAGVITVATAIIGLVWQLQSHPHRALVATVALPAISHLTYGDPNVASLRPATTLAVGARRVCTDELRPKPRSGVWHCNLWSDLSFDAVGVQATGGGDPCTHRTTNGGSNSRWQCQTTVAIPEVARHMPYKIPVFFGDLMRGNGVDQKKVPGVCWYEFRASSHVPWRCGSANAWRPLLPSFRAIRAVDPGGPCVYRTVDEVTGVWWCMRRH